MYKRLTGRLLTVNITSHHIRFGLNYLFINVLDVYSVNACKQSVQVRMTKLLFGLIRQPLVLVRGYAPAMLMCVVYTLTMVTQGGVLHMY